jgi:hypothetical protein
VEVALLGERFDPADVLEESGWEAVTWFKVDDGFHCHPKILTAGNEAIGLWVRCGSYCSQHMTGGRVPRAIALMYGDMTLVNDLVKVGLFEPLEDDWLLHDFHDYNPTREQAQQERALKTARQQRWRERNRNGSGRFGVDGDVDASTDASRDGGVDAAPPRPAPPRPVPPTEVRKDSSSSTGAAEPRPVPEGFDAFWRAYPKRVDKKYAEECYAKALTKVSPTVLVTQATFYAMEQKFTDKRHIKNPSTWLNRESWNNEPMDPPAAPLDANEAATLPPMAVQPPGSALVPVDAYGGDRHMARQAPRYAPKPSTTDQRVGDALGLAEFYRSQGR